MAKLVWDQDADRRYQNGVSKVVLYPKVGSTYPKGYAWSGVTAITENPGGDDVTKLWADNVQYGTLTSSPTYGYSVESYTVPKEFYPCDGIKVVADGVYLGQQKRQAFGATWRTEISDGTGPDVGYNIVVAYNGLAGPASKSNSTRNESPDAATFSREVTCSPVSFSDNCKPVATFTFDSKAMDATKLKALEDALYGTDQKEAYLPDPAALLTLVGGSLTSESTSGSTTSGS